MSYRSDQIRLLLVASTSACPTAPLMRADRLPRVGRLDSSDYVMHPRAALWSADNYHSLHPRDHCRPGALLRGGQPA